MQNKDLVSIYELPIKDIMKLFATTKVIKEKYKKQKRYAPLKNKTLGMIFEKSSTRTRVSFDVGMYQLGGHSLLLNSSDMQLSRGESIKDTARTLSRYLDAIMIRSYDHKTITELAEYADIPVINGLSDLLHPCQILSDLYTIMEKKRIKNNLKKLRKIKIAYFGDGNTNVCNSWLNISTKLGLNFYVATKKKYFPEKKILETSKKNIKKNGGNITVTEDPASAAHNADIIYTDVWISMGKEREKMERLKNLKPYQVNKSLLKHAKKDVLIMHCLPAHRDEEITNDVLESKNSIVFDQAENRLHMQKAILFNLIK